MSKEKSLYIHIPFCDHICGYCDFVRVGYQQALANKYLIELRKDLKEVSQPITSIYIGGGTPSSLSIDQLDLLFDSMKHLIKSDIEVTIEANPESLSLEKIKRLKGWGVNRVSLGVQSTNDTFLKSLDRLHSFKDVKQVIQNLHNHDIDNISMDFMYGLPNQTLEDVKNDLIQMMQLNPNHLSLYSLTIEPNSAFGRRSIKEVDNQLETQMYMLIQKTLLENGYIHYEISNYCKNGYQSKHNLGYWKYSDFKGIGIGASSKLINTRMTVDKNINHYLQGQRNYSEYIQLDDHELMFENLMMQLRLEQGINIIEFNHRHEIDLLAHYQATINNFIEEGLLEINNGFLHATAEGRLMLHDILVEFMD